MRGEGRRKGDRDESHHVTREQETLPRALPRKRRKEEDALPFRAPEADKIKKTRPSCATTTTGRKEGKEAFLSYLEQRLEVGKMNKFPCPPIPAKKKGGEKRYLSSPRRKRGEKVFVLRL